MTQSKNTGSNEPTDIIDLKQLFHIIARRRWLLIGCIIVFLFVGFLYGAYSSPSYQSNMLLQSTNNNGLPGQNAGNVIIFGQTSQAQDEAAIIPSRGVLSNVVKKLNFDTIIVPRYFPLIGKLIANKYARKHPDEQPAKSWLGMKSYSWGNDWLTIPTFEVSRNLLSQHFQIKVINNYAYQLLDMNGKVLATSEINHPVNLVLAKNKTITLIVSAIHARPGVMFEIYKQKPLVAERILAHNLKIKTSKASQDLLNLTYEASSPTRAAEILSAIGHAAINNQIASQARQASEVLAFLHNQLPHVKNRLSSAEAKLNKYIKSNNGIDLPTEAQNLMQNLSDLDQQIAQFKLQLAQSRTQYTEHSQQVKSLLFTIDQLNSQRNQLITQLKKLPRAQQKQIDLMRNAKIQDTTYSTLLQQIQQYQILKAGTVGTLVVVDDADIPLSSTNMPTLLISILWALVGAFLGILYIFIEAYFILGITSSEQIEEKFGLSLVASIHDCKIQTQQEQGEHANLQFVAELDEHDLVAESFRSLFTYLQFELPTAKNNIIAIHGPTPGIGKSFISANLAYSMAQREKRVLLIDGDIRKGHLADYFGTKHDNGLVDVLLDKAQLHDTIKHSRIQNLDFLPCGHVERQFTELLTKSKMQAILEAASHEYDYVVVDTAPILTISDAMLIAPFVGTNLLVLCQGKHDQHEIQLTIDRFRKSKVPLQHFIFNRVSAGHGYYGRYSNYYRNYYRSDKQRKNKWFQFWRKPKKS